MKRIYKILLLIVIIAVVYWLFKTPEISHEPGILAPDPPKQSRIIEKIKWERDDFQYRAMASFELVGRVLSIRNYGSDDMSDFCPVDIAMGWNRMSDQAVIDNLDIKQQHRWYVWKTDRFPIPRKEIESSSSNIHIIPSNEEVEDIIDDVIRGNIISLKGKLVNVNEKNKKFTYQTSLDRKDTGGGACEILWLEELKIIK